MKIEKKNDFMRYVFIKTLLIFIFFSCTGHAVSSPWFNAQVNEMDILDLRFTSSTEGVGKLDIIPASLEIVTQPGWKIYWRNPGDAGLPPEIIDRNSVNIKNIEIFQRQPN